MNLDKPVTTKRSEALLKSSPEWNRYSFHMGFMEEEEVNPVGISKYHVVYGDDDNWVGVYVDGELHYQGHDIPDFVWIGLMGASLESARIHDILPHRYEDWDKGF